MGTFPDFSGKKRIIFIDNVSSEFAKNYGGVYPNAVFFTNDTDIQSGNQINQIWKGGEPYANYVTVDENSNSIEIDGNIIRLSIDRDGCLRFTSGYSWYWYCNYISIGNIEELEKDDYGNKLKNKIFGQENLPSISNSINEVSSIRPGWNYITSDNNITNPHNENSEELKKFLAENMTCIVENDNLSGIHLLGVPLYSPHRHILSLGLLTDENVFKHPVYSNLNLICINVILPKTLVDNGLGLYDDFGNVNFISNAADTQMIQNKELPNSKGIYYYYIGQRNKSGVKYSLYTIIIATESKYNDIIGNVNMNFNLSLYIQSENK